MDCLHVSVPTKVAPLLSAKSIIAIGSIGHTDPSSAAGAVVRSMTDQRDRKSDHRMGAERSVRSRSATVALDRTGVDRRAHERKRLAS